MEIYATNELRQNIQNQVKYYLSDDNLMTDSYLRNKMDAAGFVDITLLAGFKRLKSFTKDIELITDVMRCCEELFELNDSMTKVRPRNDPLRWPAMKTLSPTASVSSPHIYNLVSAGNITSAFAASGYAPRMVRNRAASCAPGWIQNNKNSYYGMMRPPVRGGRVGIGTMAHFTQQPVHSFSFNPEATEFVPHTEAFPQMKQSEYGYGLDSSLRASATTPSPTHSGEGDSGHSLSSNEDAHSHRHPHQFQGRSDQAV